jgi:hypothetical protein
MPMISSLVPLWLLATAPAVVMLVMHPLPSSPWPTPPLDACSPSFGRTPRHLVVVPLPVVSLLVLSSFISTSRAVARSGGIRCGGRCSRGLARAEVVGFGCFVSLLVPLCLPVAAPLLSSRNPVVWSSLSSSGRGGPPCHFGVVVVPVPVPFTLLASRRYS